MRGALAATSACALCGRTFAQRGHSRHAFCGPCRARADKKVGRARTVKCGECGKPFSTSASRARYCSDPCRSGALRRYNREYMRRYVADPEKRAICAARTRASAAARRARARAKDDKEGRGQGRPRQSARGAGHAPRAAPSSTGVCALCGRTFAQYGRTAHSYCRSCTAKADREIARVLRVDCRECGKRFPTTSRIVRYCSDACRAAGKARGKRKSNRERMADPEKRALAAARIRARKAARSGDARG